MTPPDRRQQCPVIPIDEAATHRLEQQAAHASSLAAPSTAEQAEAWTTILRYALGAHIDPYVAAKIDDDGLVCVWLPLMRYSAATAASVTSLAESLRVIAEWRADRETAQAAIAEACGDGMELGVRK